jgi:S1-C subfamily serine protease
MPVLTTRDLESALSGSAPGDAVRVTVARGDTATTVEIVLSSSTALH